MARAFRLKPHFLDVHGNLFAGMSLNVSQEGEPAGAFRSAAKDFGSEEILVPSKGLEPPHPCGYMDLNHARLPIPPRWPGYYSGSFRHFG